MSMEEKQNSQTSLDFNQNIFKPSTREEIVEQMAERQANARNVFTGEPLTGQDLQEWRLVERQREYSTGE